jgi:hypothetical protein
MNHLVSANVFCLTLAACGSGDSIGPAPIPDLAGAYDGAFTVVASTTGAHQDLGSHSATATISQQKSAVSIVLVPAQGGTFSFSGSVLPGGAITLEPDAGLSFLTLSLPQCDFTSALVSSDAFPRGDELVVTADVTGVVCPWHESDGQFVPTTFEMRYEGTAAPTS